jgi:hypothetical protein
MNMLTRVRFTSQARLSSIAVLLLILVPLSALAQGEAPKWDMPPRVVDEPAGLARLRATYEHMTVEQLKASGFQVEPVCVTGGMVGYPEYGNMGMHAINPRVYENQFQQGMMDPDNPPIVVLDGQGRVVAVEWEAKNTGQTSPVVYGQTANLGPAHPGVNEPHYMLHAFFLPEGKVQFGDFSQTVSCEASHSGTLAPLPNTGGGSREGWAWLLVLATTLSLLGLGLRTLRRGSA